LASISSGVPTFVGVVPESSTLPTFGLALVAAIRGDVIGAFADFAEHRRRRAMVICVSGDAVGKRRTCIVAPVGLGVESVFGGFSRSGPAGLLVLVFLFDYPNELLQVYMFPGVSFDNVELTGNELVSELVP
jgi:hypothetical protein